MTSFYKFESAEQFLGIAKHTEMEFDLDGISVSVIGLIADGGQEPVVDEATGLPVLAVGGEEKPDGTKYKKGDTIMQPTYLEGWHVNASAPVTGWEDMAVTVASPMRVFG